MEKSTIMDLLYTGLSTWEQISKSTDAELELASKIVMICFNLIFFFDFVFEVAVPVIYLFREEKSSIVNVKSAGDESTREVNYKVSPQKSYV